ncbi:hypothetical protein [Psychromonas aquatilis]|uniref:Uncharacterized protein n=1 Tax=Psychromonas aquatilis TaxID=2005072 RepID=A0ABU9GPH8_9GAMM
MTHKMKSVRWLCLFFAVCFSSVISAHTIKESTAQVILRDGQVAIKIITQEDHLVIALQNNLAWLMGDLPEVMPDDLTASEQKSFIEKALLATISLQVNKQKISLQRADIVSQQKGEMVILLQAKHTVANVTDISVSFSKTLGIVHASFVKPQYQLLKAGESATAHF